MVLEKTLESPLNFKEIQPVHPKGDQSWVFTERTDVEAETPILWPPDANWLIWKDLDARKDWRQEEKETTEYEMVRWHHWLDGHGFEQAPGVGDGQEGLACCGPWGHKESTEWLNWTKLWWLWRPSPTQLHGFLWSQLSLCHSYIQAHYLPLPNSASLYLVQDCSLVLFSS